MMDDSSTSSRHSVGHWKKMTHYKYKITHVYFDALFYMSIQVQFINLSYVWIIKRATGAEMTVETYRQ